MKGSLPGAGQTFCANHESVTASSLCEVCGKPLCGDCSVHHGTHILCEDPVHQDIVRDWALVSRTSSEFEADMIVRNLAYGGFRAKVFSSREFTLTIGENREDGVNIFLQKTESESAVQLLQTLGLVNGTGERSQHSEEDHNS